MDQPAASHDMLLRFLQVDTMHSAGSAAVIPSRIGSEVETVLGATHPNGTSLSDLLKFASGGAGAQDELGTGSVEGGGRIVIGGGGGVDDIEHERKYGPRKTAALVVLLLLLGGAVWAILHWRRHRRRERYRRLKGKGRAAPRNRRRREEEGEEEEEHVGITTRMAASEPIPTIAVFDVGEYEDDTRSEGAGGGGARDDDDDEERQRSSFGKERSGGRGGRFSLVDDDDERGDRAGDLGRAVEDANPFREDERRRYEKSMRS